MIFDELVLHNVGVFGDRHTFALTPPSPDKPVILIGALNGGGKTTFLDAIQLALFGPMARTTSRGTGSYQQYLRRLIHNGVAPADGASIELAFHIVEQGEPRHYRVCRSWTGTTSGAKERLDVLIDGKPDQTLSRQWAERVDAFVPRGVAELFFFDGEKIETLAELDNAREVLRTAIGALLGLDLVDRLTTDLTVVERNHKADAAPPVIQKVLDAQRNKLAMCEKAEAEAKERLGEAKDRVAQANKALAAIEAKIRLEGGELLDRSKDLEAAKRHLSERSASLQRQMVDVAGESLPFALVREQLVALEERAGAELEHVQQRAVTDLLGKRDQQTIRRLRDQNAPEEVIEAMRSFLAEDRKARRDGQKQSRVAKLNHDAVAVLRQLTGNSLDEEIAKATRLAEEQAATVAELEDVLRSLAEVPAEEALEQLHEERNAAHAAVAAAVQAEGLADFDLKSAASEKEEVTRVRDGLLNKAAEEFAASDDSRRLIDHSQRVRATLAKFKHEATRRNVDRIEKFILESLQRLARKNRLITDISIDPETFEVELQGRDGTVLLPQQLSAGERQLLAVSMLWGLAQASGRPLPVVIDTPLGRLDGIHRNHLIERYFPQASHQVILLSTDQEIDEPAWQKLRKHVGHTYQLEHDNASGRTSAKTGYLW
ncbi:DNA sulfur modification protein DndD [Actinokineospora spheciospongiae]|uniref:DNA sulfur modification protein DndD n=1 Tax=Actinokineospora spheciospongiae TaxID=909613 RepID=UPI000D70F6A8|nr:DNA sulfur modification protein DndD [Actinokineospora spheciospongiae]PWW65623.1 DNA sulfur modification protein DndD [Actinokineospora spheciospongiae]